MADNVAITAGAGTSIATDDAGAGGHVQVIKLAISSNGSAAVIPADATNGLSVDVTRIAAGDTNIGNVDVLTLPAIPAGTNNIGDVDVLTLPALATGTNTIGGTIPKPTTSGGLSMFTSLDLDETEEAVKGSAGQLYGWYIYNDGTSEVYVKIFNATTASVTIGSTAADLTIPIPATSAANVFNIHGIAFGTAITAAATTGVATADSAAPAANQVVANFFYS